ncbi:MAG: hypothetical protein HYW07_12580 [Candidatus Latescibacteria bacterium]|nr:hypothetical protein [Candidatus Latescibacterota bacterium]
MAEEGSRIAEDRIREDVAEIKGEMRQMNQRISNLEQGQRQLQGSMEQGNRWLIGLILGAWVTLALAILGLYAR